MSLFSKQHPQQPIPESAAQKLYKSLSTAEAAERYSRREQLGENMEVIHTLFIDHWKPRYLLNHNTQCAYEFMNEHAHLVGVADTDIDWSSLEGIEEQCLYRARMRDALFPSFIGRFHQGVAQVKWQLNPDGRYWMDEDGFGMTPDVAFDIYGYIDTACRMVVPYQAIRESSQLQAMRTSAEQIVAARGGRSGRK